MAASFYFYDLETTGVSPREDRIVQFAGQRTDLQLVPIGKPDNLLIKLTDETLPAPDAVLVTGITPQKTRADGITEAEFLRYFYDKVVKPNTIFAGFNNVRFDDEFMRFLNYRNFYDAYEWQWKDGRSRWDLLDVTRMARALRPEGIDWPFASDGTPTNKLEFLSAVNNLEHVDKHDALGDVKALIALTRLIKQKQPKLFEYLLEMRDKKKVKNLVETGEPFVYSSGKYPSEYEKTTIANFLGPHSSRQGALVYDLRQDPTEFLKMTPEILAERWAYTREEDAPPRVPVKSLKYNRNPAVAPLGVLDDESIKRLRFDLAAVKEHRQAILADKSFHKRLLQALDIMDQKRQTELIGEGNKVDEALYDDFIDNADKPIMSAVRASEPAELSSFGTFNDERLNRLLPLYKARNFPESLESEEREAWEEFRSTKLLDGGEKSEMARYFKRIDDLVNLPRTTDKQRYLLEELRLWGESIMPDIGG